MVGFIRERVADDRLPVDHDEDARQRSEGGKDDIQKRRALPGAEDQQADPTG